MKNNFFRKNISAIVLAICCLPVFFLNVKDSHDWGDDFAQYIIQARNIIEHRPQTDNGLVFDGQSGDYALRAYPVGFPMMLASVLAVKGNSIKVFSYFTSLIIFILCMSMFFYFKKYFSQLTAFFLVLIFLYNPFTLAFKMEVLSDLPFTLFLLIGVLLFVSEKKKFAKYILTGIIAGMALSIRGIGITFLLAVSLNIVVEYVKQLRSSKKIILKEHVVKSGIILCTAFGFYFLLNTILFHIPSKGFFNFYANAYHDENVKQAVLKNLEYYIEVFKGFFEPTTGQWQFASKISKSLAFVFLLLGITSKWFRRIDFEDLFVIIYIIVLLVYPYTSGGFRFILPVFPFLLIYIVEGIKCISIPITINKKITIAVAGMFMLLLYVPSLQDTIKYNSTPLSGPQENSAKEILSYIKNNLPANAVIVFAKPRALALYTSKKAAYVLRNQTEEEMRNMFERMGANYFLIGNNDEELNDIRLKKFLEKYKDSIKTLWNNEKYFLYEWAG